MKKNCDYIFDLSPKKLAIYLVLGPLLLFMAHTLITIIERNISGGSFFQESLVAVILIIIVLCLAALIVLWLLWFRSVVYSVTEKQLGFPKKWFRMAYAVLVFFIIFNCVALVVEYLMTKQSWGADYLYLIFSSREFINFGGIMIAYPIVCHYAARAIIAKRNNEPATFIKAIPFTLVLIFGAVVGIPFQHNYFSTRSSTKSQILIVYAIAFGLCILLFIVGFIAAITGLV